MKNFTTKQQRFIDAFDVNAVKVARKAGYKLADASSKDLMAQPQIVAAISSREHPFARLKTTGIWSIMKHSVGIRRLLNDKSRNTS